MRNDESGDLTASLTADTYLGDQLAGRDVSADATIFMPFEGRRLPFTAIVAADKGRGPVGKEHIVHARSVDGSPSTRPAC